MIYEYLTVIRATDTSDPIISSVNLDRRIQRQKRMSHPLEVLDLLECSSKKTTRRSRMKDPLMYSI